jgi:meiotically up-regulated gene 157 (Mug157) protein
MLTRESGINFSTDSNRQTLTQQQTTLEQQIRHGFFGQFRSSEDVYKYLVKVGTVLVVEREKITQLFKKIQQSYSELFYHSRGLLKECQELDLLKDYLKMRAAFYKQKLQILEKEKDE